MKIIKSSALLGMILWISAADSTAFAKKTQVKKKKAAPAVQVDYFEYQPSLLPDPKITTQTVVKDLNTQLARLASQTPKCIDKESQVQRVYPVVTLPGTKSGDLAVSVLTPEELQQVYKEISENPDLGFKYPEDGCDARAHFAAQLLEKKGIRVAKVFAEGELQAPATTGADYIWRHHTTISVAVQGADGKIEMMVIDPILFKAPATVKDWGEKLKPAHGPKPKLYFTERFHYSFLGPENGRGENLRMGRWKEVDSEVQKYTLERIRRLESDRLKGVEHAPSEDYGDGDGFGAGAPADLSN